MSKSKRAPVNKKSKSIPQFELQAAVIASRLKQKITKKFKIPIKKLYVDRFKNNLTLFTK